MPTKVIEVDLAREIHDIQDLDSYPKAMLLLRWRGAPLGQLWLDVKDGQIKGPQIWSLARHTLGDTLLQKVLDDALPPLKASNQNNPPPAYSVVVCTRNRAKDLKRCIDSLLLAVAGEDDAEIIIVDNNPSDDTTRQLVAQYPGVRYVLEPRPGLNWARTKGASVAKNELVIYTDDDVKVDPGWARAMAAPFANPQVSAVTGLILPLELETEAQEWFERYGGFSSRGFTRREFTANTISPIGAANVGAGASMALRRQLVNRFNLFAVELDCGTKALTGGDTYAFYRLLSSGHLLIYNPQALAWHRHRRTHDELNKALHGYSVGTCVYLLRCLFQHKDAGGIYGLWWWWRSQIMRQLWLGLRRSSQANLKEMTLAELKGYLASPKAYLASLRREKALQKAHSARPGLDLSAVDAGESL